MNLKFIKQCIANVMCVLLLFSFLPNEKTFAAFEDFGLLGGRYGNLLNEFNLVQDSSDKYICHYLISKKVLDKWSDYVYERDGKDHFNEFLVGDLLHEWAPAIIMERADHDIITAFWEDHLINDEANRIIYRGDIITVIRSEIDLIRNLFNDKYDKALSDMYMYIRCLNFGYENSRTLLMNHPYIDQTCFRYCF